MKSIVLLNFCDGLYGGIESFLLNAFYCIDRTQFDITFLTCGRSTYDMFRDDITEKGGHVEEIPVMPDSIINKILIFKKLRKYFRESNPDIVHINSGTLSLQFIASFAAKIEGVDKVILHSHNFRPNQKGIKEKIKEPFKRILVKNANVYLACSKGAALWMFPKKMIENVVVIPNGIDTKKFLYNNEKRFRFRKALNVGDELLIGNIGRFEEQKNHIFMLEIIANVVNRNPLAKLLLVGEGPQKNDIQLLVKNKGLSQNVLFLGERKDMDVFLSAIDVFILPSKYEGFGIAAVEAEAAGAKVLLSNVIPKETNVSGSAVYLPIEGENAADIWCDEILKENSTINRMSENNKVYNAGFDIHICYEKMINIYREASLNVNHK